LGPGTVTIDVGDTPLDFSAEVKGAKIMHSYDETSDAVTYLDGSQSPATQQRTDGFAASLDNNLTAAGLYQFLVTNDLAEAQITFTPNTGAGATWSGSVILTLPDEIGTDDMGTPIASEVDWSAIGTFTYTPAT
jgi:hypothetical protein